MKVVFVDTGALVTGIFAPRFPRLGDTNRAPIDLFPRSEKERMGERGEARQTKSVRESGSEKSSHLLPTTPIHISAVISQSDV